MLAARASPSQEEEEVGVGIARTARQACELVRAARRCRLGRERRLDASPGFDCAVEREFPAFRALEIADVARAHAGRQRRRSVLPELGLKHVAILSLRTNAAGHSTRDAPGAPSRANVRREPPARARTIPLESGIGSSRGFSCSEDRAAAARLQTMKSHLSRKKSPYRHDLSPAPPESPPLIRTR